MIVGTLTEDSRMHVSRTTARAYQPKSEHAALSAAVDLDPARLYAATNMTDVRDVVLLSGEPEQEGCTSVLVPPSERGGGLYGFGSGRLIFNLFCFK